MSSLTKIRVSEGSDLQSITFDYGTIEQHADGSDEWPMTWCADGHHRCAWGDGGGFGGTNTLGRVSIGVGRIEGTADSHTTHNILGGVNPENGNPNFDGKSNGIIEVGGSLYMIVSHQDVWTDFKIGRSADDGASWAWNSELDTWAGSSFIDLGQSRFVAGAFVQMGKGYNQNTDGYVYILSWDTTEATTQDLIIARVDISSDSDAILDTGNWEYYTGSGWSSNINSAGSIYHDDAGVAFGFECCYIPERGRFLLSVRPYNEKLGKWAIYQAPNPWGPYTELVTYTDWDSPGTFPLGVDEQIEWNVMPGWLAPGVIWWGVSIGDSLTFIKSTYY